MRSLTLSLICAALLYSPLGKAEPIQEMLYRNLSLGEDTQISMSFQRLGKHFIIRDFELSFSDDGSFSDLPGKARYSFEDIKSVTEGAPMLHTELRTADGFRTTLDRKIVITMRDGGTVLLSDKREDFLLYLATPDSQSANIFVMNPPRLENSEKSELRQHRYIHVLGYGDKFYHYTYRTEEDLLKRLDYALQLKQERLLIAVGAKIPSCRGMLQTHLRVIEGGKR